MTDGLENAVTRAEIELTPSKKAAFKGFLRNLSPFALPVSKNTEGLVPLEYHEAHVFSLEDLCRPSDQSNLAKKITENSADFSRESWQLLNTTRVFLLFL